MRRVPMPSPSWQPIRMMLHHDSRPVVVKVGGSLYDLPQLGPALGQWVEKEGIGPRALFVPGGGPIVEACRSIDRAQSLGDENSHWLALEALILSARILAWIMPGGAVVRELAACSSLWDKGRIPILDPLAFALADEGKPGSLPHSWDVTSDSIACRVAIVAGASRLILLKSVTIPEGIDWAEAGRRGYVDPCFHIVLAQASGIEVRAINFREWTA
jgi:aspartokinase-like uncharacterized kinase